MIHPAIRRIVQHPVAIGGVIGLAVGLATAVILIVAGDPWYARGEDASVILIYWLDFPIGTQIHRFTDWGWDPAEHRAFTLVGTALNGLFLGLAGTGFVRAFQTSARLRRTILRSMAIEIPLIVALLITGIPSPFAGPNPPAMAATMAHAPGIFLLTQLGLCCGYVSHLVISDFFAGAVQHPTPLGMVLLALSNVVMFIAVGCAGGTIWRRISRRFGRERTAPVAPA